MKKFSLAVLSVFCISFATITPMNARKRLREPKLIIINFLEWFNLHAMEEHCIKSMEKQNIGNQFNNAIQCSIHRALLPKSDLPPLRPRLLMLLKEQTKQID